MITIYLFNKRFLEIFALMYGMVIRVGEFSSQGTKLNLFLKNNNIGTQKKLLNFEDWCNGEVLKSALF